MSDTASKLPELRLEVRRNDNDDYPHNQGQNLNISFWETKEGGVLDGLRLGQMTKLAKNEEGKLVPEDSSTPIAIRIDNATNKSVSQLYYPVKGADDKFESLISAGTVKYKKIISKGGAEYDACELVLMPAGSEANTQAGVEYRDLSDETKDAIRAAQREAGLYYATAWPGYKSERTPENGIELLKPEATVESKPQEKAQQPSPKDFENYSEYMVALMGTVYGDDERAKAYAMSTLSYAIGARIGFLARESDATTASETVKGEVQDFLKSISSTHAFITESDVMEVFEKASAEKQSAPAKEAKKDKPKEEPKKESPAETWDESDIPF